VCRGLVFLNERKNFLKLTFVCVAAAASRMSNSFLTTTLAAHSKIQKGSEMRASGWEVSSASDLKVQRRRLNLRIALMLRCHTPRAERIDVRSASAEAQTLRWLAD